MKIRLAFFPLLPPCPLLDLTVQTMAKKEREVNIAPAHPTINLDAYTS